MPLGFTGDLSEEPQGTSSGSSERKDNPNQTLQYSFPAILQPTAYDESIMGMPNISIPTGSQPWQAITEVEARPPVANLEYTHAQVQSAMERSYADWERSATNRSMPLDQILVTSSSLPFPPHLQPPSNNYLTAWGSTRDSGHVSHDGRVRRSGQNMCIDHTLYDNESREIPLWFPPNHPNSGTLAPDVRSHSLSGDSLPTHHAALASQSQESTTANQGGYPEAVHRTGLRLYASFPLGRPEDPQHEDVMGVQI